MESTENNTIEARMRARQEHPVLLLRRTLGKSVFRYAVGVSDDTTPMYSIYAEFALCDTHTAGEIPAFSCNREMAENFCILLERMLATPLSLCALYEDSLTP